MMRNRLRLGRTDGSATSAIGLAIALAGLALAFVLVLAPAADRGVDVPAAEAAGGGRIVSVTFQYSDLGFGSPVSITLDRDPRKAHFAPGGDGTSAGAVAGPYPGVVHESPADQAAGYYYLFELQKNIDELFDDFIVTLDLLDRFGARGEGRLCHRRVRLPPRSRDHDGCGSGVESAPRRRSRTDRGDHRR